MSIVTGAITKDGAVIVVLVGVSRNRQQVLERSGFAIPAKAAVRAQLDTGSAVTAFMPEVFRSLGIKPFDNIAIRTPSTTPEAPCHCDLYDVSIVLVSGDRELVFPSVHAIGSEDFVEEEEVQAIIGRDILQLCVFNYYGPDQRFELAF